MSNPSGSINSRMDCDGINTLYIRSLAVEVSSKFEVWLFKILLHLTVLQISHDEILSHFSAFGDVDKVRIDNETNHSYGFVKFTLAESAAKALRVDSHIIAGREVKVDVATERHQDLTTLLDRNDESTLLDLNDLTFLDLNDDCLLEILSMKCLTINDLCSAAETCQRLKEIAGRVFGRKHKTCDIRSLSQENKKTAKRILRNFGSAMSDLEIKPHSYCREKWPRELLDHVTKYCSETLRSLGLFYIEINESFSAVRAFKNLQKLSIDFCTFQVVSKEFFADCLVESLVELNIAPGGYDRGLILENTFPKLERFKCGTDSPDSHLIESFISRHMNLKSLKIRHCSIGSSALQLIADLRLETLECCIPKNATLDLSNLGHLRELEIFCNCQNITKIASGLENLKLLENLRLINVAIDSDFVRTLSQLEKLKILELLHCDGLQNLNEIGDLSQLTTLDISTWKYVDLDFVLLVKRLCKLNYLKIEPILEGDFQMDLGTYLKIVDVVKRRAAGTTLKFKMRSYNRVNNNHLLPHFARYAHLVEMTVGIIDSRRNCP